jgi:hypothetical protein
MFMIRICVLLGFVFALQQLPARTPEDFHASTIKDSRVTNAPLFLSVTGKGRVFPFRDGQMLQVGREYTMIAVPDRGYIVTNWVKVIVFTETEYVYDQNGNPLPAITSVIRSPTEYTGNPVLKFTMQPVDVILNVPDVTTITVTTEWQANFVPGKRPGFNKGWWRK